MEAAAKFCTGCGIPLQSEHPDQPGYTPAATMQKDKPVCKRCFRIRHYNEVAPTAVDEAEFVRIVSDIGKQKALVIKVIDLFDFSGSWINNLRDYIGANPVILVANKADLLPRQTNLQNVEEWLRREVEKKGIVLKGIALVSAGKGLHIEKVKTLIEKYANDRDIYVVGTANVGKSTLINRLIGQFGEAGEVGLTTSRYPGTTLSAVQVAIPHYSHPVIDTPGIMTRHRLTDLVCPNCLKLITPDKTINPRVYQLNERQTLFLGGLARIDFVSGGRQSFVCYVANQLYIHRTKLENADEIYQRHVGEILVPPCADCGDHLRELVTHKFMFNPGPEMDIVISGLGWITLQGEACEVHVHVPRGVNVSKRGSII